MRLNRRRLTCARFLQTNFGDPFFLSVGENESVAEIKDRIKRKLGVGDDEFAKVRCLYVSVPPGYQELTVRCGCIALWPCSGRSRLCPWVAPSICKTVT